MLPIDIENSLDVYGAAGPVGLSETKGGWSSSALRVLLGCQMSEYPYRIPTNNFYFRLKFPSQSGGYGYIITKILKIFLYVILPCYLIGFHTDFLGGIILSVFSDNLR